MAPPLAHKVARLVASRSLRHRRAISHNSQPRNFPASAHPLKRLAPHLVTTTGKSPAPRFQLRVDKSSPSAAEMRKLTKSWLSMLGSNHDMDICEKSRHATWIKEPIAHALSRWTGAARCEHLHLFANGLLARCSEGATLSPVLISIYL